MYLTRVLKVVLKIWMIGIKNSTTAQLINLSSPIWLLIKYGIASNNMLFSKTDKPRDKYLELFEIDEWKE